MKDLNLSRNTGGSVGGEGYGYGGGVREGEGVRVVQVVGVGEGAGRGYERVGLRAPAILAEPKGCSASAMLCMHSFSIRDPYS